MNDDQIKAIFSSFFVDSDGISEEEMKFANHTIKKYVEHLYQSDEFFEAVLNYRHAGITDAQDAFLKMFDVMRKCDDN